MLITVVAPEFILAKAWLDLLAAQYNCKAMKAFAAEDGVEWKKAHAYYANMGGFVIEFGSIQARSPTLVETPPKMVHLSTVKQSQVELPSNKTTDVESMRTKRSDTETRSQNAETASTGNSTSAPGHSSYYHLVEEAKEGHIAKRRWHSGRDQYRALSRLAKDIWVLDASQLLTARKLGIISKLPDVTEDEIMDQSKSDVLAKTLAVLQIGWLVIQLITRAVRKLPSSQLEIAALAFGISAIVTNGLLYKKPQDVEATRRILATRRPQSAVELSDIAFVGPGYLFYHSGTARTSIPNNSIHTCSFDNFRWYEEQLSFNTFVQMMALGGGVFGAIHCIAWNFTFPTFEEQIVWRIMSLISIAAILLWGSIRAFLVICRVLSALCRLFLVETSLMSEPEMSRIQKFKKWGKPAKRIVEIVSTFDFPFISLLYLSSRVFLTVEMFRALAFAPPETFIATFTMSLPTIG